MTELYFRTTCFKPFRVLVTVKVATEWVHYLEWNIPATVFWTPFPALLLLLLETLFYTEGLLLESILY